LNQGLNRQNADFFDITAYFRFIAPNTQQVGQENGSKVKDLPTGGKL